jgi:hypothetical protein
MSDQTPATAPAATTPATEQTPAKSTEPKKRSTAAVESLRARLAEKSAAPAPAPEAPKAAETAAKIETIEAAGGKAPDQKDGESDAVYHTRVAKMERELRKERERAKKAEDTSGATAKELEKYKKLYDSGKENPLAALKEMGWSFKDVVQAINDDKIKEPTAATAQERAILERLEKFEQAEKQREEELSKTKRSQQMAQDVATVRTFVQGREADFPLSLAVPNFAESLVEEAYEKGVNEIAPMLQEMEKNLQTYLEPVFLSEPAMVKMTAAAVKKNPALKAALAKALGFESGSAAEAPSTASLDQIPTTPGTPEPKKDRTKRKAEALAQIKAGRAK